MQKYKKITGINKDISGRNVLTNCFDVWTQFQYYSNYEVLNGNSKWAFC